MNMVQRVEKKQSGWNVGTQNWVNNLENGGWKRNATLGPKGRKGKHEPTGAEERRERGKFLNANRISANQNPRCVN